MCPGTAPLLSLEFCLHRGLNQEPSASQARDRGTAAMNSFRLFKSLTSSKTHIPPPLDFSNQMYPENCYKWSVPWPCRRIHWLSRTTWLLEINFDEFYKVWTRTSLSWHYKKWFWKVVYLCLSLDVYKQNSDLNMNDYMHSYLPPHKKSRASGVMNQIRMCCEPWPDSTMNPSRAQRSSETILHGAGFLFWLRTHIWFQSQGPNVSCRLKMSTPVWSKNRVYYIKSHHTEYFINHHKTLSASIT